MIQRHNISYRKLGNIEVWVNRVTPRLIEVVVYDFFLMTESRTDVATLDAAMTLVSDAISKELRRQQGEA